MKLIEFTAGSVQLFVKKECNVFNRNFVKVGSKVYSSPPKQRSVARWGHEISCLVHSNNKRQDCIVCTVLPIASA